MHNLPSQWNFPDGLCALRISEVRIYSAPIVSVRMSEVFSVECTNIPFMLYDSEIIFVEREYEWYINQYIGRNRIRFEKAFANFHYDFCYLPVSLNPEQICIVQKLLQASLDINCALCKFAYMDGDRAVFYCVELDNDEKQESLAKQFYHFACWCTVESERRRKWFQWDKEAEAARMEEENVGQWQVNSPKSPHIQVIRDIDGLEQLEEYFDDMTGVTEGDEVSYIEVQLRDIQRQLAELRKLGVSEERIREAIEPEPQVSRIEVTKDYHIMLPDLGKEIILQPILKALFLLFLRHPEGINFKDMPEYKAELIGIYEAISDRVNARSIDRSIGALCSPINNSIHEKCSRIRETITELVGSRLAPTYCITGGRGENKRIAIPPEMVNWE